MSKLRLGFATAAVVLLGCLAGAVPAMAAPSAAPALVGGQPSPRPYPGMASLQINHDGDPNFHTCAAVLVAHWYAVTNAHCVTNTDDTAQDPHLFHLRVGSTGRTRGGIVVDVDKVLVHPDWGWARDPGRPVADLALLHLRKSVPLPSLPIASRTVDRPVRLLGWGLTDPTATSLPLRLQQLDTTLLPPGACVDAGLTAGEICLASPHGTGACYGDSGGPALQRQTNGRWADIGGASRETNPTCGLGPVVYTDLTYYRRWITDVIRTGKVPPITPAPDGTRSAAVRSFDWAVSPAR